MGLKKFKCQKCHSSIAFTEDVREFSCMYCEAEYIVEKTDGAESIKMKCDRCKGKIAEIDSEFKWKS